MEFNKQPRILFDVDEIAKRIKEMGEEITTDYEGSDIVVISLLRGSLYLQLI